MPELVRIAGGGLSGLATGLLLARRGLKAEVFDRHPGGGGRFQGGWQVLDNATSSGDVLDELKGLGLPTTVAATPMHRVLFLAGAGRRFEATSERPYAYFIRRGGGPMSLDGALREAAEEAGVTLRDGENAPADCQVLATGPRQADGVARETVFTSDLADTVAVLFDPELTPTGYAYLFCLDGWATFGVAQVRQARLLRDARCQAWERFRAELGEFSVRGPRETGQFMSFALPRRLHGSDGRWYVGEAAGIQDFLFGLGNRLALRSAALVAMGVTGDWDQRAFRRGVIRPMRTSISLRFAYERLGRRGFALFARLASRRDFRSFLLRLQRPSLGKELLAAAVMPVWRARGGCRHAPVCRWCRAREA